MPTTWKDYIESTSDVLRGKPRIKNTRIPVALVIGYLADGYSADIADHRRMRVGQI